MKMRNSFSKINLSLVIGLIFIGITLFQGCGSKRYGMEHVDPDTFESLSEMGAYYDWWLKNLKEQREEQLAEAKESLEDELNKEGKVAKKKSKQILKHREKILTEFEEDIGDWKMNRAIRKKLIQLGLEALKKDYDTQIMEHDKKLKEGLTGETERIKNSYKDQYFAEEAQMISRLEKARNLIYDQKDRISSKGETTMLSAQIQIQKRDIAQVERETNALQSEIVGYENRGQLTETSALSAFDYINLSAEYFYANEYYEAMVACKMALEIEPNMYVALAQLGSIYYMMEYYEDAVTIYEQALEINPEALDIQVILADLKIRNN
jgi:tetratricopeptide (TPR) repeat protein